MPAILVTTDLSKESLVALEHVKSIAQRDQSKVFLLCVVEDSSHAAMAYALDFPVLPDPQLQRDLAARLQRELQAIAAKYLSGLNTHVEVLEAVNPVHTEILTFAERNQIDLIVMATHGRMGIKHLLIGSVTERVVRESRCPVLVVPARSAGALKNDPGQS